MRKSIFENDRLVFKPFQQLTKDEKELIIKSWSNPFNARYNATKDARKSVENISNLQEPTFKDLNNYYDCMFFRAVFDKKINKLVGTCRFGKFYKSKTIDCWDFGFNVLLKYWYKGYGVEILGNIVEIAKSEGAKTIVGSADAENFSSYKAMIKNKFIYSGLDGDGDFIYSLDLKSPNISDDEINKNWNRHLLMAKERLGAKKYCKLEQVNAKTFEMVKRIWAGEDEDLLVKYYNELILTI